MPASWEPCAGKKGFKRCAGAAASPVYGLPAPHIFAASPAWHGMAAAGRSQPACLQPGQQCRRGGGQPPGPGPTRPPFASPLRPPHPRLPCRYTNGDLRGLVKAREAAYDAKERAQGGILQVRGPAAWWGVP